MQRSRFQKDYNMSQTSQPSKVKPESQILWGGRDLRKVHGLIFPQATFNCKEISYFPSPQFPHLQIEAS